MLVPFAFAVAAASPQVALRPNLVISRTAGVTPRVYHIPAAEDLSRPAITIKGNGITVDFRGATLEGTPQTTEPSERKGLAIRVQGRNITIRNVRVRGYKIGLLARNCPGLKILDSDFSYNWKQHLGSTVEREDQNDWMFYHHNDHDEWIYGRPKEGIPGYAGAIYLHGCDGFELRGCKAQGGQCGLMLTRCDNGLVWNNDFSFLSGIGLAMYRSSDNRVMHNKLDWCVRGFSYGHYYRGQDSAAILVYEQSSRNTFAYNSATHSGDGFFLWAGQTTMDTGEGGCNDNLVYGNDFSYAPTNGIEATFSRNKFVNNKVVGCWHGLWGGYSYDSPIIGNFFGENEEAIDIEHGQNNPIESNIFNGDKTAIHLYWNPGQDPNWGYPKHHDTKSRDYTIHRNSFYGVGHVAVLKDTTNVAIVSNSIYRSLGLQVSGDIQPFSFEKNRVDAKREDLPPGNTEGNEWIEGPVQTMQPVWQPILAHPGSRIVSLAHTPGAKDWAKQLEPAPLKGGQWAFLPDSALQGRKYMIVDQWGPYDFKRPLLWPREDTAVGGALAIDRNGRETEGPAQFRQHFQILGPKGRWRAIAVKGGTLTSKSGEVPGSVWLESTGKAVGSVDIQLEYVGKKTTDYRGIATPAGKAVQFGYSKFVAPIDWTVHFYKWTKSSDKADPHSTPDEEALQKIFGGPPVKELTTTELDFAGAAFDPATGNNHFATRAEGSFTLPAGEYVLELTTDDGARLWLDGKPLIQDAWHYQGPTVYSRDLVFGAGGVHTLRLEHFQIDGYAQLKLSLTPTKRK